jgi:sporulation protein YlmC with PRC-barrel domain
LVSKVVDYNYFLRISAIQISNGGSCRSRPKDAFWLVVIFAYKFSLSLGDGGAMKDDSKNNKPESIYFLSDVLNAKVLSNGKKIGKLSDLVIVDKDKVAEVTHLVISRSFGYPSLMVPWEKVRSFGENEIVIDVEDVEEFACKVPEGFVLLKDYILDKKILDMEDTEVEVVYDIKMVMNK